MSGRDVRRLAARATNMTHEAKRDMVARVAAGAQATGVTDIYVTKEPFRIASLALANMGLDLRVHVLDVGVKNDASDTERSVRAYLDAGCEHLVSLGGDGTSRAIVRALLQRAGETFTDVTLIPLSTGTNNVYPLTIEPTIAGMVAGLFAGEHINRETAPNVLKRSKVLHVTDPESGAADIGLIDAVLLERDHVGNLLPFDTGRIKRVVLTRAEPEAIGMSPIGGLVVVVDAADDWGLSVDVASNTRRKFAVPVSPGLFRDVGVKQMKRVAFGEIIEFTGPGVLALDGDRDHKIPQGGALQVRIVRDGPWVPDVTAAMRTAVARGIMRDVLGSVR